MSIWVYSKSDFHPRTLSHHATSEEIMVDKLHKKICFYCAEAIRSQTVSGVHTATQSICKTSKCAARSVVCTKCEGAGLTHFHHVRAACPFDFEFCKKIAADNEF